MTERLAELLARLRERFAADAEPDDVAAYLRSQGYDRRQIGEILTHLFPERSARAAGPVRPPREAGGVTAFRVQGPHERGRFQPEAWGHLLSLSGSGMLSPTELEHVVERAMTQIDGPIALDDLRALLESAGFDDGRDGDSPVTH